MVSPAKPQTAGVFLAVLKECVMPFVIIILLMGIFAFLTSNWNLRVPAETPVANYKAFERPNVYLAWLTVLQACTLQLMGDA